MGWASKQFWADLARVGIYPNTKHTLPKREEERCPVCGERENCPAYESGVLYPCPYYKSVTQKRAPDPLATDRNCVTEDEA